MRQTIEGYLRARFSDREELSIGEVKKLQGGASHGIFMFTAHWRDAQGPVSEDLVIRREPDIGLVPPYDISREYEILKRIQGTGVPVPKTYCIEKDSKVLERPFVLMERITGGDRLIYAWGKQPEHRARFFQDFVAILSKIHGLDWQTLDFSFLGGIEEDRRQSVEKEIARWEKVVEENQYVPYPTMAELLSWLKRNIPDVERITFCHGDYQVNNCYARDGRIAGVFDWEMADIGDPIRDVGYACVMHTILPVTDWDESAFIRSYEKMTGTKVNAESLFFWKVFTSFKLSAIHVAAIKAGCEAKVIDMQLLALFGMTLPMMMDIGARMLNF